MGKERAQERHCAWVGAERQKWKHYSRTTGPPCKCKEKCFEKVDDKLKKHILTSFNNMPDKARQDQYLSGLVLSFDPTWVGTQGRGGKFSETNKGKKLNTFKYYVPKGNFF